MRLSLPLAVALVSAVMLVGCDIIREDYHQRTGKPEGTLVANIGMPLEEVERRSTLRLSHGVRYSDGMVEAAQEAVFDLELAGTGLRLERCRQYFLFTRKDDSRLERIEIYATPSDLTWAQVDAAAQAARAALAADGWTPGRFVYHVPEPQAARERLDDRYGQYWLKGDVVFEVDPRPAAPQPVGSDPQAGEFILFYRIHPLRWEDHPYLEFPGRARPTPAPTRQQSSQHVVDAHARTRGHDRGSLRARRKELTTKSHETTPR